MRIINLFSFVDLLSKLALLFVVGYLPKAISPSIYAAWSLLLGLSTLLSNIGSFGFSTSISRFLPSIDSMTQKYYLKLSVYITILTSFLIFIVLFLFSEQILNFYKINKSFTLILYLIPFLCVLNSLETLLDAYFKVKELILQFSIFTIYKIASTIGLLLYFFRNHAVLNEIEKIETLFYWCCTQILVKVSFYILLTHITKSSTNNNISKNKPLEFISFLNYGWPTVAASIILWCFGNLDKIILNNHLSSHDLGVYFFGSSIASYTTYLGILVFPLFLPRISKLFDTTKNLYEIENYFNKSLSVFIRIASGLWVSIALFHREIIMFTAGSEFLESSFPLLFLSFYYGIDQALGIWAYVYHLIKKPIFLTYLRIGYLLVFSIAIYGHSYFFKPVYLPLSILGLGIIYNFIIYIIATKLLPIKVSLQNIMFIICSILFSIFIYNVSSAIPLLSKLLSFIFFGTLLTYSIFKIEKAHTPNLQKV